jgi:hypothetical protein
VYEAKVLEQLQCLPMTWHATVILFVNHMKIALCIKMLMGASNELSIRTMPKPVSVL